VISCAELAGFSCKFDIIFWGSSIELLSTHTDVETKFQDCKRLKNKPSPETSSEGKRLIGQRIRD
jgi:hypothetical protein